MKILEKAQRIAFENLDAPTGRQRHFSFITNGNTIIAWGCNNTSRTHPVAARYSDYPYIHSELAAILAAPVRPVELREYDLINLRVMRDGSLGMAKPCRYCRRLLQDFQFKSVFYSNNEGNFEQL